MIRVEFVSSVAIWSALISVPVDSSRQNEIEQCPRTAPTNLIIKHPTPSSIFDPPRKSSDIREG